jgi:hypothetical protein
MSSERHSDMDADRRWHLDKRVPIALIVTIILQTGGIIWWAASANERLATLERRADATAPQSDRLTRVEVKLEVVQEGIVEIKRLIQMRPP